MTDASRRRWRWQYLENPHTPTEGPRSGSPGRTATVLGQYASMPVRLLVGRHARWTSSWGMDVFVRARGARQGRGRAALHDLERPRRGGAGPGPHPVLLRALPEAALRRRRAGAVLPEGARRARGRCAGGWDRGSGDAGRAGRWRRGAARVASGAAARATRHRGRTVEAFGFPEVRRAVGEARAGPTPCACGGTAPTWTGSTRAARTSSYDAARRRGATGALAGFAVSRHEDYRGLRLGWIDRRLRGRRRRRRHGRAPRARRSTASARGGVARAQAFSMNAALGARPAPPRLLRGRVAHAVLRARARRLRRRARRPRTLARRLRRQRHGPMSARRRRAGRASTPRPTTSGRPRGPPGDRGPQRASACPRCRRCSTSFGVRPELRRHPRDGHAAGERRRCCATSRGSGRCEIGTHLHPWSSPPFRPEDLAGAHVPSQPARRTSSTASSRELTAAIEQAPRRAPHDLPGGPQRLRRAHAAHPGAARVHRRHQRGPALQRAAQGRDDLRRRSHRALPPGLRGRAAARARRRSSRCRSRRPRCPACPRCWRRPTRASRPSPGAARSSGWDCGRCGCARPTRRWRTCSPSPIALRRAGAPCFNIIFHSQRGVARRQPLHAGRDERGPLPRRPAAPARRT